MKAIKIILGLFCFALTLNAFKDGLEPGESFAYYLPITIVFIIGILLFRSVFKTKEKK